MLIVLEVELVTARSRLPSPLKSPATTAMGLLPPFAFVPSTVNAPVPSPSRMLTLLLLLLLRTARSMKPSPLKSPTATLSGLLPIPMGDPVPPTVCCAMVPPQTKPVPGGKPPLDVSRRDTFPPGDSDRLPVPVIVAVSDQFPVVPPVCSRLAVVGY